MKNDILGDNGFGDNKKIDIEEYKTCKRWIKKWLTPTKSINKSAGSYRLKGAVEKSTGKYVSNGAFIKAALDLGYTYQKYGELKAFFNASFDKAKKNSGLLHFDI